MQYYVVCRGQFIIDFQVKITYINRLIFERSVRLAKIITISNQKGGVGKTTTAINLSACVAVAERRTLLFDIDPQANATSGLGIDHKKVARSSYEVLLKNQSIRDSIIHTSIKYLDIVPSSIRLVGAEIELVNLIGREKVLREVLGEIEKDYDYVFIDCPPSLGLLTVNALTAAHFVLIPIQCEYYALEGLSQLLTTIRLVQKNLNPNLEIEGVLLTMYDNRLNLSHQVADDVRKFFGSKVFKSVIYRNVRLSEAPSFGKPVILYDAVSIGAENYIRLAEELIAHEHQK